MSDPREGKDNSYIFDDKPPSEESVFLASQELLRKRIVNYIHRPYIIPQNVIMGFQTDVNDAKTFIDLQKVEEHFGLVLNICIIISVWKTESVSHILINRLTELTENILEYAIGTLRAFVTVLRKNRSTVDFTKFFMSFDSHDMFEEVKKHLKSQHMTSNYFSKNLKEILTNYFPENIYIEAKDRLDLAREFLGLVKDFDETFRES